MKKFLFILLLSSLLISAKAPEGIQWYSLKEGIELAALQHKPMMFFIHFSWCDKCQRMEKKIFPSKEVSSLITENYIPVKLDPEVDSAFFRNDELMNRKDFLMEIEEGKYGIAAPTTVLFKGKDSKPMVIRGLVDPKELKDNLIEFLSK